MALARSTSNISREVGPPGPGELWLKGGKGGGGVREDEGGPPLEPTFPMVFSSLGKLEISIL